MISIWKVYDCRQTKNITASSGTGVNEAILVKSGLNDDEMSAKAKFALAPINGNIQMVT